MYHRNGCDDMKLYHYYEKERGPFRSISDLSDEEAEKVLADLRAKTDIFLSKRPEDYLKKRRHFEEMLRSRFLQKGGTVERKTPHYMVVEACPFFEKWYEQTAYITVDAEKLDMRTVSFTYGDSHPTFSGRVNDGREYRGMLYDYDEILRIIDRYGLPQIWNPDLRHGPEAYVEVQIWSDRGLEEWLG